MDQDNIKTLDVEDFKGNSSLVDYVDDDFAIVSNIEDMPSSHDGIKLKCFLIVVCCEGTIQVDINHQTYKIKEGDLLFGLPNTLIRETMLTPHCKLRVAAFSTRFLFRTFRMERNTWDTAIHIYRNPVKSLSHNIDYTIPSLYGSLLKAKIDDEPHEYHKEVMQHLFSALFCELMGHYQKEMSLQEKDSTNEELKQSDHIMRKFMMKLSEDNGKHRSVSYFANELCYTPKHFSKVIKQSCGRTPLELINDNAMDHIKYRLKHSDKSIKEIAEEFNFPNQSFFGKYVKMHIGMSPANYRNMKEE